MNNMNMVHVNIPDGWKWMTLGKVSKIYDGTHQTPNYVEHGVPFYSVEHVTANNFSQTKYVSEDVYVREARRTSIERGDILMTRIGDIGTARHIDWDVRASFYVSLALIKCKENFNSKFVSYLINSHNFQRELWQKTIHVAFPNKINLGDISRCRLLMPPLNEQDRIVAILETWDKTIENLSKTVELKREITQGLMQELLTAKTRLPGFADKWSIFSLAKIAQINPKADTLPTKFIYIDLESVTKGKLLAERWIEASNAPSRAQRLLKDRDIIFQMVRPYQMNNFYFSRTGDYVASTGYAQLRSRGDSKFLYYMLHTKRFVSDVISRCTGSSYPAINSTDLGEIELKIPSSIDEQSAIAKILTIADLEIQTLERKLKIIQEQKRYILNNLVAGNIRIPEGLIVSPL